MNTANLIAAIWPLDGSFDGMLFIVFVVLVWTTHCTIDVAKKTTKVITKALDSDVAKEAGKGFLEAWLDSLLRK